MSYQINLCLTPLSSTGGTFAPKGHLAMPGLPILLSQLGREGRLAGRGQVKVKVLVTQSLSSCFRTHRLEYWSGLPFPSPGDLPNPGIEQVVMFSLLFLFVFPFIVFFWIIFKHFSVFHFNPSVVFCCISLCSFLVVSLGTTIHILNLSEST